MSKLYKKVRVLVSRHYYHGGDGLENLGLAFFRSREEYERLAQEKGWNDDKSFRSSWCTPPVEMIALVNSKDWARFQEGNLLTSDKVFFPGDAASQVHKIGGWQ